MTSKIVKGSINDENYAEQISKNLNSEYSTHLKQFRDNMHSAKMLNGNMACVFL